MKENDKLRNDKTLIIITENWSSKMPAKKLDMPKIVPTASIVEA